MSDPATDRSSLLPVRLIGWTLIVLGAVVTAGWVLKLPILVQFMRGYTAMVFNTALGFMLTGAALALAAQPPAQRQIVQTLLGTATVLLAGLVLSQDLLSIDLGVDHLFSADWLQDHRPHPTRMAPNTAIAFILSGATLVLLNYSTGWTNRYLVSYLAIAVGLIGFTALSGYLLGFESLFTWYPYARMAAHTALGFTLLGIGLWLCGRCARKQSETAPETPDARILYAGGLILTLMALIAGIGSFLVLSQQTETTLKRGLEVSLNNRVEVYRDTLFAARIAVLAIATNPIIRRELGKLNANPDDAAARQSLQQAVIGFTELGISGVMLLDNRGRPVVRTGGLVPSTAEAIVLNLPHDPELIWDDGIVMRIHLPVEAGGRHLGTLIAEQPLGLLNRMFQNVRGLGETGEMVVCARREEKMICLPTHRQPEIFVTPRQILGRTLAMSNALDGFSGVADTLDYRGRQVIAAYSPVHESGLGMVLKMDVEELYQPIYRQFHLALTLLLMLVAGGTLLLRWQVLPLARRLVASEQQARQKAVALQESEAKYRAISQSANDAIISTDEEGLIVFWNSAAQRIFGYSETEIMGKTLIALMPQRYREEHRKGFDRFRTTGEAHVLGKTVELHGVRKNGEEFPVEFSLATWKAGDKTFFTGILRDISQRKQAEETIRNLSLTDELTGLYNRRGFLTLAESRLKLMQRMDQRAILLFIDLDGMKKINDNFGHQAGDQALRDTAAVLRHTFRESDIIARVGGDEFAVLALDSETGSDIVLRKRLQENADGQQSNNQPYRLSLSLGVARFAPQQPMSLEALIAQADGAMYKEKQGKSSSRS